MPKPVPAPFLTLPWPDRALHPNARPHWTKLRKAAREARHMGQLLALEAGWHLVELPAGKLHVWWTFDPPNLSRKRDDDGLLSSMKPYRDGIADALKIDDHLFVSHPYLSDQPHPGGRVIVRISAAPVMPEAVPLEAFEPKKPRRAVR
ncbi:MAG TPA: hypothetical protein VIN35_11855 [Hydrogenophaga sp.]